MFDFIFNLRLTNIVYLYLITMRFKSYEKLFLTYKDHKTQTIINMRPTNMRYVIVAKREVSI